MNLSDIAFCFTVKLVIFRYAGFRLALAVHKQQKAKCSLLNIKICVIYLQVVLIRWCTGNCCYICNDCVCCAISSDHRMHMTYRDYCIFVTSKNHCINYRADNIIWWIKNVRACKVCHEHALLKKQREAMALTNTPQHCIHLTYRDHHIHLTYTRYSQHNLHVVIIAYILYTSPP